MCIHQQLRWWKNPPPGGLRSHSQVQPSSCVDSLHRWQEAPRLPSTNSSANCGWRMATSKFHLLLFCHLLYSETHSSEAQAHWDSDKFCRLWLVISTRLDYFNINSLPNLNPIKYILQGPGMAVMPGIARCSICVRAKHLPQSEIPSPSSRTPFSQFFPNKGKRTLKPLRWMNSFSFWWDYAQENSSKVLHRLKSELISPSSFLVGVPASLSSERILKALFLFLTGRSCMKKGTLQYSYGIAINHESSWKICTTAFF